MIQEYTLTDGRVFTDKMMLDLLMWKNLFYDLCDSDNEDFNKLGIKSIRDIRDRLKELNDLK